MRKKRNQVTCECSAYGFPHRLGGGNCNCSSWFSGYRQLDLTLCGSCNCFNGSQCEVITGQEDYKNGDCYQQELRSHWMHSEYGNLPVDVEALWQEQYQNHNSGSR